MKWTNPFDAPPPILRAPRVGEDASQINHDDGIPEIDPNLPLEGVYRGEFLNFSLTATWREYFSIWIVCQALSLATLGLYAPFAKARKSRYLAQNISLGGHQFNVNLDPIALLKGRLLALALLIAFGILALMVPIARPFIILLSFAVLPWLLSRAIAFRWWRTAFANKQFGYLPNAKALYWPCSIMGALTTLAALPISELGAPGTKSLAFWLMVTSFGLMFSLIYVSYFTTCVLHQRFVQARLGHQTFRLDATPSEIFKQIFAVKSSPIGWTFTLLLLMMFATVVLHLLGMPDLASLSQTLMILALGVFGVSFGRATRFNFVMNRLALGEHLRIESTLPPKQTAFKFSGYAVLNVLTLGLAVPWTTIKAMEWRLAHLRVNLSQPWDEFLASCQTQESSPQGALEESLFEPFNIDISL
jgi:uncharacterized membrane protein YjgN (DUF898 family)